MLYVLTLSKYLFESTFEGFQNISFRTNYWEFQLLNTVLQAIVYREGAVVDVFNDRPEANHWDLLFPEIHHAVPVGPLLAVFPNVGPVGALSAKQRVVN